MKELSSVEKTMLIPLMIKSNETKRKNARIKDLKAVEIISKLGIDNPNLDKFMSHEGVIARTILFDKKVSEYIKEHPNATCINLGCGLDDRFSRVDNGKIFWYDLDLDEVIKIRRKYFEETPRRKILTASILDEEWPKNIKVTDDVFIIIEGVLMYFTQEEVKQVFKIIGDNYKATIFAELMCKKTATMSETHDTVKHTNAKFKWGCDHANEIAEMLENLEVVSDTNFNVEMKKHSFRGWLFGTLPMTKKLNNRIAILKFI